MADAQGYYDGLLGQGYTPDQAAAFTKQYFPDFTPLTPEVAPVAAFEVEEGVAESVADEHGLDASLLVDTARYFDADSNQLLDAGELQATAAAMTRVDVPAVPAGMADAPPPVPVGLAQAPPMPQSLDAAPATAVTPQDASKATKSSQRPKNKMTAIMAGFIGFTGADRFFLGYILLGAIKLALFIIGITLYLMLAGQPTMLIAYLVLTAAVMWWIVDLVMIVTGRVPDSTGTPLL